MLNKHKVEKLYWTIGELAKELGMKIITLRFWETEIKQLRPKYKKGKRRYSRSDRELVLRIWFYRNMDKYTWAGVRQQLAHRKVFDDIIIKGFAKWRADYE